MALYWTARLLEVHQGWLYNYIVFIDDDVDFGNGNLTHYEDFLRTWQPAVGLPGYIPAKYPRHEVQTIGFYDYIFVGYHREAVETVVGSQLLNFNLEILPGFNVDYHCYLY